MQHFNCIKFNALLPEKTLLGYRFRTARTNWTYIDTEKLASFFLSELAKRGAEWNTVCRTVSRWLGKKTPSAATSRVSDSIKSCRKNEDGMRPKKSDPRPPCVIELLSPEKEALPEYSRGFGEILN